MNISGKTPLLRAKELEKHLGIKEIYLKLEGANPFGHKNDRVAEVLIKDATAMDKKAILVDGTQTYIKSLVEYAKRSELEVIIPIFANERWKKKELKNEKLVDLSKIKFENKMVFLSDYCKEKNYYNGTGYDSRHLSHMALEELGEEITKKLKGEVSSVFTQLSYGYTVTSLYNGFVREWVQGDMEKYPRIYSCTIPKGNKIYDDYKKNLQIDNLDQYDVKPNRYSQHLFTDESHLIEETLKAVRDTNGSIISIDEGLLKESANLLRNKEDIVLSTEDAYAFAGFYKMVKEGKAENGKHVIILNDGRSDVEIKEIKDFSEYTLKGLTDIVEEWLVEYGDPRDEMEDAVENAIEKGYFFLAYRNGVPQGVCVLVNIAVDTFLATYHLAYIGTKVGNKGRGIATKLIERAIEVSEGKLSLHVEMENIRAKKLYEKVGFKAKYFRMNYMGD